MALSKLSGGFDCEFVEKPSKFFQTECLICLLVLREPYQVICCGKSFCRVCIQRIKALNYPCPHCNSRQFSDFPNKGFQQALYQYTVLCTFKSEGCEWKGELGDLDNHLNVDPQPYNLIQGCVFVTVQCSFCFKPFQRKYISHHQRKVCRKRPFTCEYCNCYGSTFEDVTCNHWHVCKWFPVQCPNVCGAILQRQNIVSHITNDCLLTVIGCDFSSAGCKVKLPRKDMGQHLRVELVAHMSMMAISQGSQIAALDCKVEQGHSRIKELQKENEVLKQRITELEKEKDLITYGVSCNSIHAHCVHDSIRFCQHNHCKSI